MLVSSRQNAWAGHGPDGAEPVRVLICDDSAVIRAALQRMLGPHEQIVVDATARNGQEAVAVVKSRQFDVVILDIEMPVMDGLTALPLMLAADPGLRVLMSSTLTTRGASIALEALRLGASDYIAKPSAGAEDGRFSAELTAKILGLGRQAHLHRNIGRQARSRPAPSVLPGTRPAPRQRPSVLAVGSSTGGPAALLTLFGALGKSVPVPILLTQHMPPAFISQLAAQIERMGGPSCSEAADGEALRPGHIHLAPGNMHLGVAGSAAAATVALSDGPPENFCRPAVDPMLRSVADVFGGRVLVLMLTGMGQDGLLGAEKIVGLGGCVIAQDEASSVVWGMPGAVARAGLCHAVLPLPQIAPKLNQMLGASR